MQQLRAQDGAAYIWRVRLHEVPVPSYMVSMSADVLTVCVPTFTGMNREYPSANRMTDRSRGRKPPGYHSLREAVAREARAEIARVGWEVATYYCEVRWTRYMPSRLAAHTDAQNAGIAECNALADAGVVENDRLIQWHPGVVQYDPSPGAIDRISLVVIRTFPPAILADKPARKPKLAEPRKIVLGSTWNEIQAEARRRTAAKPRTLAQMKQGDQVTFAERDALREAGILGRR
jgi:hypothetical protein